MAPLTNYDNVEECWSEHNSADDELELAKHLADNKEHFFLWSILLVAPKYGRTHKKLEVFFIANFKPSLNRQEDSDMLTLFRNGVHSCHYSSGGQKLTLTEQ